MILLKFRPNDRLPCMTGPSARTVCHLPMHVCRRGRARPTRTLSTRPSWQAPFLHPELVTTSSPSPTSFPLSFFSSKTLENPPRLPIGATKTSPKLKVGELYHPDLAIFKLEPREEIHQASSLFLHCSSPSSSQERVKLPQKPPYANSRTSLEFQLMLVSPLLPRSSPHYPRELGFLDFLDYIHH